MSVMVSIGKMILRPLGVSSNTSNFVRTGPYQQLQKKNKSHLNARSAINPYLLDLKVKSVGPEGIVWRVNLLETGTVKENRVLGQGSSPINFPKQKQDHP